MNRTTLLTRLQESAIGQAITDFIIQHQRAALNSWHKLLRSPIVLTMTIIVMGAALALPTGLFALLHSADKLGNNWQSSTQITAYLQQDIKEKQRQHILTTI